MENVPHAAQNIPELFTLLVPVYYLINRLKENKMDANLDIESFEEYKSLIAYGPTRRTLFLGVSDVGKSFEQNLFLARNSAGGFEYTRQWNKLGSSWLDRFEKSTGFQLIQEKRGLGQLSRQADKDDVFGAVRQELKKMKVWFSVVSEIFEKKANVNSDTEYREFW